MKKLMVVLSLVFLLSFASAQITEIYIKTTPYAQVQVSASDASSASFSSLDSEKKLADEYGDTYFNFSLDKKFNLYIFIKNGLGETLLTEKLYESYVPGEKVELELIPEGAKKVETPKPVVETLEVIDESINESESSEVLVPAEESSWKKITGSVVSMAKGIDTNYYLIAGVLVFAFVGMFFMKKRKVKTVKEPSEDDEDKEIKVRKMSEYLAERRAQKKEEGTKDVAIAELESKIKTLQSELERIKNGTDKQQKIEEAKKRLIKDQEELMRLRKE